MQVAHRIRGAVSSKQYGFEDLLCPLIAQACIDVCPKNPNNFNVDNVRVIKITGSGAYNSSVVKGIVIKRDTEGTVKNVTDAKVAVFAQGVDTSSTETKVWADTCCSTRHHCMLKICLGYLHTSGSFMVDYQ